MSALEDIIDIARSQILFAPIGEISKIPKQFEVECGLSANQVRRLDAWIAFRVGDLTQAVDQMTACFNDDKYFGTFIDLARFFFQIHFPNPESRDEMISALAIASNQLRENGLEKFSLRADFVASYLLYRTREPFQVLTRIAEMWRDRAGSLRYTFDDLHGFHTDPYETPSAKQFLGFSYALAGENELAIQVNDAFTSLQKGFQGDVQAPSADNFAQNSEGLLQYHRNPMYRRTNDKFVEILLDGEGYDRVADLGCGSGMMGERLRSRSDCVIGVDMDGPALDVAQSEGMYDSLVKEDMFGFLRRDDEPFDLITSCMAVDFSPEIDEYLRLVWDRLTPGGLLAFAVIPCGKGPIRVTDEMMGLRWHYFEPGYVAGLATSIGFRVVRQEFHPYQFSVGAYFLLQRQSC